MGRLSSAVNGGVRTRSLDETVRSFESGARVWIRTDDLVRFINYLKAWDEDFGHAKRNSMVGSALRKAGWYIAKISRQNLRKGMKNPNGETGNLLSSYTVKVKRGFSGVLIGFNSKGHHAHLVDLGHEVVVGKNKVKTGKRTKPLLFHTSAREHMPQAGSVFVAEYEREIIKHAQYWDSQGRNDIARKFK